MISKAVLFAEQRLLESQHGQYITTLPNRYERPTSFYPGVLPTGPTNKTEITVEFIIAHNQFERPIGYVKKRSTSQLLSTSRTVLS